MGHRQSGAWSDPYYRLGDNLFTNSLISWDPDTGKMNWYHQYTTGDMWDYDEEGSHILIDGEVAGQPRKMVAHAARNGFFYAFERANGQPLLAKPYVAAVNWTKGIIRRPAGHAELDARRPDKKGVPSNVWRQQLLAASYSPKTRLMYIPSMSSCNEATLGTRSRRAFSSA